MAVSSDNALAMSWRDSAWIPMLNPSNVMDYFAERSNLFYDRSCNNEMVKMQRLSPEQISNLTGIEYILLHVQEPILYVIRKLHRHSPTQVTPLADYYIIAGTVYQAPDVGTVINSRILNAMHNVGSAFDEALSFSRYHPSKGYWWAFKDSDQSDSSDKKDKKRKKEEPSSYFQRQRVDVLLGELGKKYPPKAPAAASAATEKTVDDVSVKVEVKQEVKVEKTDDRERASAVAAAGASTAAAAAKPPPEKKPKLMR